MKTEPQTSFPYDVTERWLRHARIPPLYWYAEIAPNHALAGYGHRLAANITSGRGLLLMGPHGVGKTYTATSLAIRALPITRKVMYITAPDLVDSYKPGAKPFDEEMTMEDALRSRELLVLDDLGHEYKKGGSEFAVQMLVNLIRFRTVNKLTTIITTNLNPASIEEFYTEGFRSLLAEHCGGAVILKGTDRRRDPDTIKDRNKEAGIK